MNCEKEEGKREKKFLSRNGEYQDSEEMVFTEKLKKLWSLLSKKIADKSETKNSEDSLTMEKEAIFKIFQSALESNVSLDGQINSL